MRQLLGENGIRARDISYIIPMFNEIRINNGIRMILEENLSGGKYKINIENISLLFLQ